MALTTGTRLGHYEIISLLGHGGMGEVYRAQDTKLGRDVAIKLLLDEVSEDPERLVRFEREARVLASLNHNNIATLHGFENEDDTSYLVMELVEGETLADRISRGPIPVDEAIPLFLQISEGLEAAHEKGIIHRDLKPANVKVSESGQVKILDFGLAKAMEEEIPDGDLTQSPTLTANATQAGVLMGTAAYMSPEQVRGQTIDRRADIWAFGACLYEALTRFRASGGEPLTVTELREGEVAHFWPEALPGGEAVLFGSIRPDGARIEVYLLEEDERRILVEGSVYARYVPTGHLIYTSVPEQGSKEMEPGRGTVMAVPFDPRDLRTTGPSVAILPKVVVNPSGYPQLTFSKDGTLAYVPRGASSSLLSRLVWVDRAGNEDPLDQPARAYGHLRISPDGLRVATHLDDAGTAGIHVLDLVRGTLSRITFDQPDNFIAVWSPDGQDLYFASYRDGIYRKRVDGTGSAELVLANGESELRLPYGVTSDGSLLLIGEFNSKTITDIGLASLTGDGETHPLLHRRFAEFNATLSPDERWIAYDSDESGRGEVYVQPFPDLEGKWQISVEGGANPVWGPDGKELFYSGGHGVLMRVPVIETEPTFVPGTPKVLFQGAYILGGFNGRFYDISPGGERFLVLKAVEEIPDPTAGDRIVIVENWFEELKRLVPTTQ